MGAGILPTTIHNGKLFFLFGKENKNTNSEMKDAVLESERIYQQGLATIKDLIAPAAMAWRAS